MKKKDYYLRNSRDYNESLVNRGDIRLWVDDEVIESWYAEPEDSGTLFQKIYSDDCIRCGLRLRALYRLPLRALQGFLASLFALAGIFLKIPHFSTFSRRQEKLGPDLSQDPSSEATYIAIDSTGIKVFGEGEWKTRVHGYSYRRTWRKLHLAVDVETHEIKAVAVSTNDFKDGELLDALLDQLGESTEKVFADGAYESFENYESIRKQGAEPVIPPRKDAKIRQHGNLSEDPLVRDEVVRSIKKKGRKRWKQESEYHLRNISETAMFRFKNTFGDKLLSRTFNRQVVELIDKCNMLNTMAELGMPDSVMI